MTNKEPISFRLTPQAKQLIQKLAKKLGISQADVIEIAVRKLAEQESLSESET